MFPGLRRFCFSFTRRLGCGVFAAVFLLSCSYKSKPESPEIVPELSSGEESAAAELRLHEIAVAEAVEKRLARMDADEKIAQLFIIGIEGEGPSVSLLPGQPIPGSFLFFKYNISDTPRRVIEYTNAIRKACPAGSVPPFLAIDHEGGIVNRLRSVSSPLPSARLVAQKMLPHDAEDLYRAAGAQLNALGFQLNLAPVAEAETEISAEFLDSRSYGAVEQSAVFAGAAVRGFQSEGVIAAVKHFPGNTGDDPHVKMPRLDVSLDEFESVYLEPFRSVFREKPAALVLSHVLVPYFDAEFPVCLSERFVAGLLRYEMEFPGLIISDDLYMAALSQIGYSPEKAAIAALSAGVNMLMLSVKNFLPLQRVIAAKMTEDAFFSAKIDDSVRRILRAKYDYGLFELESDGTLVSAQLIPAEKRLSAFNAAFQDGWRLYDYWFK